ncbi:MAG: NYN domain-containing protein [Methyloligellaceae bacterium]
MNSKASGPCLSAVFVDYDNIYLSLKRKSEDAAKCFAKDINTWLKQIETGSLVTPTNGFATNLERRLVMNRCYGNPVPRRNSNDSATDMSSFPFVRHHFLRGGFEIVDCPPLTAQLKNSSDIRMVMDIRDFLDHDTYYDEFIIMSGDADFTPVLHRLRSHARRTVIYANEYTATPYTAICDGEIREADLISFLLDGKLPSSVDQAPAIAPQELHNNNEELRREIMEEVVGAINSSDKPVPIAFLADKAQRSLGHDKTVGSNWAGFGAFRTFLNENLPQDISLTETPPYYAFNPERHQLNYNAEPDLQQLAHPAFSGDPNSGSSQIPPATGSQLAPVKQASTASLDLQKSIARIHEASHVPPLAPPDYRVLFKVMTQELSEKGLNGGQTISSISMRSKQSGVEISRDDVQFLLDVVSEADPWFEQGVSPELFAGRVRNFVIARCRQNGLQLSTDELELIEAWFIGVQAPGITSSAQNGSSFPNEGQNQATAAGGNLPNPFNPEATANLGLEGDVPSLPRFVRQHMRGN